MNSKKTIVKNVTKKTHIEQPQAQPNVFNSGLSLAHMFQNCGNHKAITLKWQTSNIPVDLKASLQRWDCCRPGP